MDGFTALIAVGWLVQLLIFGLGSWMLKTLVSVDKRVVVLEVKEELRDKKD